MTSHCESSPGSFNECRLSAGWPPTLRQSQSIWAVSQRLSTLYTVKQGRQSVCLVQLNLINCDDYVVSVVILAQMQPNVQLVSYCI